MKKYIFFGFLLIINVLSFAQEEIKSIAHESEMSLDGPWQFVWSGSPEHVDTIPVPACWELYGYGDVYVDFSKRNDSGTYKKIVDIPSSWKGKNIFLQFDGVEPAMTVFVNDKEVGTCMKSKQPCSFDITSVLRFGKKNIIKVEVGGRRQDLKEVPLSGITRSVRLVARPKFFIEKIECKTKYINVNESGQIDINIYFPKKNIPSNCEILTTLRTIDGTKEQFNISQKMSKSDLKSMQSYFFRKTVPSVRFWSAETPYLYLLEVKLKDSKGTTIDSVSKKIGFRLDENLEPLNGVVYQENHAESGHFIDNELLKNDVKMLKLNGFNTVMLVYPMSEYFYSLCDEYGIFVYEKGYKSSQNHISIMTKNIADTIVETFYPWCDKDFYGQRIRVHYKDKKWAQGWVTSDRRTKASLKKFVSENCPIEVNVVDTVACILSVYDKFSYLTINDFTCYYSFVLDGSQVQSGIVDLKHINKYFHDFKLYPPTQKSDDRRLILTFVYQDGILRGENVAEFVIIL